MQSWQKISCFIVFHVGVKSHLPTDRCCKLQYRRLVLQHLHLSHGLGIVTSTPKYCNCSVSVLQHLHCSIAVFVLQYCSIDTSALQHWYLSIAVSIPQYCSINASVFSQTCSQRCSIASSLLECSPQLRDCFLETSRGSLQRQTTCGYQPRSVVLNSRRRIAF